MSSSSINYSSNSFLSNYLFNISPDKYGKNKQNEYLLESDKIINESVLEVRKQVEGKVKIFEIFYSVIDKFSNKRREIAEKSKTDDSNLFGSKRDSKQSKYWGCISAITHLDGCYSEYNDLVIKQIQKIINANIKSKVVKLDGYKYGKTLFGDDNKVPKATIGGKVLPNGKTLIITTEILDNKYMSKLIRDLSGDRSVRNFVKNNIEKLEEIANIKIDESKLEDEKKFAEYVSKEYALLESVKILDKDLYNKFNLASMFFSIRQRYPNTRKSLYISVKVKRQVGNKLFNIMGYLTWMYQDYAQDPMKRMKKESKVTIIHQNPTLIKDTLEEVARLFEDIILWNSKDSKLEDLQIKIADFRLLYAACMPHCRGDGAIGDWMEHLFYRYHGFNFSHSDKYLPCFEALSNLGFKRYCKRHIKTIEFLERSDKKAIEYSEENDKKTNDM
ncbi:MAG: hypothetical protein AAF443_05330 [Chlamydiota bacterium]